MITQLVETNRRPNLPERATNTPCFARKSRYPAPDPGVKCVPFKKSNLRVMYTNCDVLTSGKMTELKEHISLRLPHIIATTEVNAKNPKQTHCKVNQDYQIDGYTLHPKFSEGRGINIWTADELEDCVTVVDFGIDFDEYLALNLKLPAGDDLMFCCIYRSPSSNQHNSDKLRELLGAISTRQSHVCIAGDFNFPEISWTTESTGGGENSQAAKFLDAVRDNYLIQHVSEPTRCRGESEPSLLDLIFTNEPNMINHITHEAPLGKSDHQVLHFVYNCYIKPQEQRERLNYNKADFSAMKRDLHSSGWLESFTLDSELGIEDLWAKIKSKLHELRDAYVPKIKRRYNHNKPKQGDFPISNSAREALKEKQKAHRRWINSKLWPDGGADGDTERRRLVYVKQRNQVTQKLRQEKRKYELSLAKEAKKKPKLIWAHANKRLKTKSGVAPL